MTAKKFIKDKLAFLCFFVLALFFALLTGVLFRVSFEYLVLILFFMIVAVMPAMMLEYWKKRNFYQEFEEKLELLDQKYLIIEMMEEPEFLEGKILCEALYETDKAMKERVNETEQAVLEFKEYIEMWIHEIKLPIASLMLMNYNQSRDFEKQKYQLDRVNHYVEQILFYARADIPQKDYLLKKASLEDMVNKAVVENKDLLIGNQFRIEKEGLDVLVSTDSKWLEFMLGQVINNSVKYKKGAGYLKFCAEDDKAAVILTVEDHGIGIPAADLGRIFDKSFTGENGRKGRKSTGMGLFLCKKLCSKLGHEIWAESEVNEYTRIYFRFGKNDYYDMEE